MWGSLFSKPNNVIILNAQRHMTHFIKISGPHNEIDKMNRLTEARVLSYSVKK